MPDARESKAAEIGENLYAYFRRHVLDVIYKSVNHEHEFEVLTRDVSPHVTDFFIVADPTWDDGMSHWATVHLNVGYGTDTGTWGIITLFQHADSDHPHHPHPEREVKFGTGFDGMYPFGTALEQLNEWLLKLRDDE